MSWVVAYEIIACRNIWVCILSHVGSDLWLSEAVVTVWKDHHIVPISKLLSTFFVSIDILFITHYFLVLYYSFCRIFFSLICFAILNFHPSNFLSATSLPVTLSWFFLIFLCRAFTSVIIFQPCLVLSFWFFSPISLFFCEFFMILSVYYYFLLCCFNPAYFGHFDSFFLFFFSSLSSIFFIYNGQLSICYNSRMLYVVT